MLANIKKLLASFVIILASSVPAWATIDIFCQSNEAVSANEGASVALNAFAGPELLINYIDIKIADKHWSTKSNGAEPMSIMQSFSNGESLIVDLSDPNVERIIAKIRLFTAQEGYEIVTAGTLYLPKIGVYTLFCEGR